MAEKVGAVADKLVERALAGNASAMRQFLDRTMPMPRGCIGFDLPDLRGPRGIADAQEALIVAVAARQVPSRDADYVSMDWPQLIDAMWDAEEAERKGPSVPAETPPAEAHAADTGDPALDGALRPVEAEPIVTASADANHEINREIQVRAWSHPAVLFDETVLQGPHQRPRRWLRLTWSRVGSDRAIAPPSPADARRVRLPKGEKASACRASPVTVTLERRSRCLNSGNTAERRLNGGRPCAECDCRTGRHRAFDRGAGGSHRQRRACCRPITLIPCDVSVTALVEHRIERLGSMPARRQSGHRTIGRFPFVSRSSKTPAPMHAFANPTRFLSIAKPLTPWLAYGGIVLIAIGVVAGLFFTPPDYLQGESVRILYVHVPAAWLGMGGWTGLAIASLMQIVWRHPLAGVSARAIAVPGALFTAICLATGSIWGRPTWGTWWEWDGRLTSMLILLFLYFGYIALANASEERTTVSRATAIFGLIGAVNIPIINRSVVWWKSLHQGPSITLKGSTIDMAILWPLGFTVLGFSLVFGAIVLMRMRAILAEARVEARMRRLAEA